MFDKHEKQKNKLHRMKDGYDIERDTKMGFKENYNPESPGHNGIRSIVKDKEDASTLRVVSTAWGIY